MKKAITITLIITLIIICTGCSWAEDLGRTSAIMDNIEKSKNTILN